jgi:hypothetical protein
VSAMQMAAENAKRETYTFALSAMMATPTMLAHVKLVVMLTVPIAHLLVFVSHAYRTSGTFQQERQYVTSCVHRTVTHVTRTTHVLLARLTITRTTSISAVPTVSPTVTHAIPHTIAFNVAMIMFPMGLVAARQCVLLTVPVARHLIHAMCVIPNGQSTNRTRVTLSVGLTVRAAQFLRYVMYATIGMK